MTKDFRQAALDILRDLEPDENDPIEILDSIDKAIDHLHAVSQVEDSKDRTDDLDRTYVELGVLTHKLASALELKLGSAQMADLLTSKQRDYGPQNILRRGHIGLAVRLTDKSARIRNLLTNKTKAANEPLRDSVVDMLGYVTIGLMLLDGSFTAPLPLANVRYLDKPLRKPNWEPHEQAQLERWQEKAKQNQAAAQSDVLWGKNELVDL
jgi:hypothetical protein